MTPPDLAPVGRVAGVVHPAYPEDDAVFAERLRLFPDGCLVREVEQGVQGYAIGHPWHFRRPPALNTLLGHLPPDPDTFHIHDLALLPAARGARSGVAAVACFARQARTMGLARMSLIAVGRSLGFWLGNGFAVVDRAATRPGLASYGNDARFMVRPLP